MLNEPGAMVPRATERQAVDLLWKGFEQKCRGEFERLTAEPVVERVPVLPLDDAVHRKRVRRLISLDQRRGEQILNTFLEPWERKSRSLALIFTHGERERGRLRGGEGKQNRGIRTAIHLGKAQEHLHS